MMGRMHDFAEPGLKRAHQSSAVAAPAHWSAEQPDNEKIRDREFLRDDSKEGVERRCGCETVAGLSQIHPFEWGVLPERHIVVKIEENGPTFTPPAHLPA